MIPAIVLKEGSLDWRLLDNEVQYHCKVFQRISQLRAYQPPQNSNVFLFEACKT